MGVAFLGQGLSMAIGGTVAYLVSWRGVFGAYAVLSTVATTLLFVVGRRIPSKRNPRSNLIAPYVGMLTRRASALTYAVVLLEGILIVGSFSYLGAYVANAHGFNNLFIGLIMTSFGAMAVVGGRISGALASRFGRRTVLALGLAAACAADALVFLAGGAVPALAAAIGLLGLGFMLAHSTLLTIATEFAAKARGMAMSLVAFAFLGGGGIGTALGGRLISTRGFGWLYGIYAMALAVLVVVAAAVVRDPASVARKLALRGGHAAT